MKTGSMLYWTGIAIVVGSHYVLLMDLIPDEYEDTFHTLHAPANLAAAGMIVVSNVL